MKKINFTLHTVAACAIAALAVACSSDDETIEKQSGIKETITLTAYQPGGEASTRLAFTNKGKAYWHAADKIGVWSNGESKFSAFDLSAGAGTATASFRGEVMDGAGDYAVYPYNENHKLSGSSLTYYLPSNYTYTSVDKTFFPNGNDGNSFGAPMYGTVLDDNSVSFKHLGGVICIQIDKMPAERGTVKVTEASNKLYGMFTANLSDETPEIKTETSVDENTVTFNYSNATADDIGVFYLPVATGNYNLTIKVSCSTKISTTTVEVEMTRTRLQVVKVTADYSYVINGHKFIDLGLPSGLLWAETNIGAENPADYGNYYAWGETTTKDIYSAETYKYYDTSSSKYTEYTTGGETLYESDDAAYVNWGHHCNMPTQADFEELSENCTWTWTYMTNSSNEKIYGYKVISKKNGNSIFFPASGLHSGDTLDEADSQGHGPNGYYWSNTLGSYWSSSGENAYWLYFYSAGHWCSYEYDGPRYKGLPVRPVAEP